jgi:iron-regulated transporter 1
MHLARESALSPAAATFFPTIHPSSPTIVLSCRQPKASEGRLHQQLRPNALRALLGAEGWSAYFQQTTLLPGLALALLYLTVLSLGFLMTSFLAWQGMSEATISVFRSAGALSGLLATVVFHPLQRCGVGLVGAASLGVTWQVGRGSAPVAVQIQQLRSGEAALLYIMMVG